MLTMKIYSLVSDEMEMPKKHITRSEEDDDELLQDFPTLIPPVMMSYGFHVKYVPCDHMPSCLKVSKKSAVLMQQICTRLGNNVFVGPNSTWVDTCQISIGARTLIGPNCSFLSATRPLDPTVRNGTRGPEAGKPIVIGEDCWLGGNCVVLAGVTIGKGSTVGAGSVVTKDVMPYTVVVGNPAQMIKEIEVGGSEGTDEGEDAARSRDVEVLAGEFTAKVSAEDD